MKKKRIRIPPKVVDVFRKFFGARPFRIRRGRGRQRTIIATPLFLCVLVTLFGCARVRPTAGQPGRPGTPLENVMAWNAAIANANLAVAQGVIAANETMPPLLDVPTANAILTEQSRIADFNRQLTFILQKSCSQESSSGTAPKQKVTCGQADQIEALLEQTRASARKLLTDVHVKDSKTAELIATNAGAILSLAQQIIGTLKAVGVLH